MKFFLSNAVLLALSLAVTHFVMEFALSFTHPHDELVKPQLRTIQQGYMVYDAEAGYDMPENMPSTPYWIRDTKLDFFTNEIGLNDRPYQGEKDYILLVGDSFTWAYGPFEKKFGSVIEKDLDTRVLKAGVPGYATRQELIKAKKVIRKTGARPKLIIVGYFPNDYQEDFWFPGSTVVDGTWVNTTKSFDQETLKFERRSVEELREIIRNNELYGTTETPRHPRICRVLTWLGRHTVIGARIKEYIRVFVEMIRQVPVKLKAKLAAQRKSAAPVSSKPVFDSFTPVDRSPLYRKAWEDHLSHLKEFKDLAQNQGSKLLVVLLPIADLVYDGMQVQRPDKDFHQPYEMVKAYCEKNGIHCLDLPPLLRPHADQKKRRQKEFEPETDFYYKIDGHLSPVGNVMVGHLISKYILENNLVAVSDAKKKIESAQAGIRSLSAPFRGSR